MPTYQGPMAGFSPAQITALAKGSNPEWMAKDEDLQKKKNDTLYKTTAKQIGITNLNSWNDIKQIEAYLAKSGGSGSSGSSGTSNSGTGSSSGGGGSSGSGSSGSGGGSTGSGSSLSDQQKAGQAYGDAAKKEANSYAKQLEMLLMSNQGSSKQLTDMMNYQQMQTGFAQASMQQQMQMMMMQGQQQFAASQAAAQKQMMAMQQQVGQMMASVAEQTRLSQNLAKAYVPEAQKTVGYTPVGDMRDTIDRSASTLSELQDLSFLPGTSAVGNPSLLNALVVA